MKTAIPMTFLTAISLTAFMGCASTNQDVGSDEYAYSKSQSSSQSNAASQMQADMQACMAAAAPGKQHEMLARGAGHWSGTSSMWMAPDTQPVTSKVSSNVTTLMDGRFTKCETSGDMPGMGPFQGLGFYGFDNVSQKYVSTWLDNCGTGMMTGDGTMSADGNTMTWTYHYNCPITKKMVTMRQVEHRTSDNAMTLDMYGNDPHSGKEFKMMHIDLTRQSS